MCLWANIILVLGSYYVFFSLTLKFNYLVILLLSLFALVMLSYFSSNLIIGLVSVLSNALKVSSLLLITGSINLFLKLSLSLDKYAINYLLSFPVWISLNYSANSDSLLANIEKLNRNSGRYEID